MKQSIFIGIAAAADIAVSFAMQIVIVTRIGLGPRMDAIYACMVAPSLILAIVQGSLMNVLVPLLSASSDEAFAKDAWGLFCLIGAVLIVGACVLGLLAPYWVPLVVWGFDSASKQLVIELTRVQLIATVLIGELAVLVAVYHARRRFRWVECVPLVGDGLGLMLLVWALPRYGIFSVVWLNVLSVLLQVLLLMPGLGRFQRPDFDGVRMKTAWSRIRPLLIGSAYYKTDMIVDRALSSLARRGGFSLLYIGQQIFGATNQIVSKSLCAPLVPQLTQYAEEGEWLSFRRLSRFGILRVLAVMSVVYAMFLVMGEYVLRLIIGHGSVTAANVHLLWLLMALSGGAWVIAPVGTVMAGSLYATGNTRLPTRAAALAYTIGIGIKFAMFAAFRLKGLALAVSLYYIVSLAFLMIALLRGVSAASSRSGAAPA